MFSGFERRFLGRMMSALAVYEVFSEAPIEMTSSRRVAYFRMYAANVPRGARVDAHGERNLKKEGISLPPL